MSLSGWHKLASYLLLVMGTTSLWLGEADTTFFYPVLVALAAVVAFFVTDREPHWELPHWISNILGVAILIRVGTEFAQDTSNTVVALAHFLVYLQVAKFFGRKSLMDYWQLYAMSLLQVTIGAVLNRHFLYGFLVIGYMILGGWTLALLAEVRHREWVAASRRRSGGRGETKPLVVHGVRSSSVNEDSTAWALLRMSASLSLCGLPLALLAFWLIPRTSDIPSSLSPSIRPLLTGFSNTVELNDLSTILESNDVVFNVWTKDVAGQTVPPPPDILWRGMVLTRYDQGEWKSSPERLLGGLWTWDQPRPTRLLPGQVELEIEQVVRTENTLFSPRPLYWARIDGARQILYARAEGRLILSVPRRDAGRPQPGPTIYRLVTDFNQSAYRDAQEDPPSQAYLRLALQVPEDVEGLRQRTEELLVGVPREDVERVIETLMEELVESGRYGYTLKLSPTPAGIDPVEHFLLQGQEGHCEYFASALALMLRVAGVPARVVTGFKGVERNEAGGFYQVRQLFAHSWVEAYIAEGQYWQTLDPTPSADRAQQVASGRGSFVWLRQIFESWERWWTRSVIGFNVTTQQESVYRWIAEAAIHAWDTSRRAVSETLSGLAWQARARPIATLTVLLAISGLSVLLWLQLKPALTGWTRAGGKRSYILASAASWEVWEDWLRRLATAGWHRSENSTPREFSHAVSDRCHAAGLVESQRSTPLVLAEAYERVRYGGQVLTEAERSALVDRVRHFPYRELRRTMRASH